MTDWMRKQYVEEHIITVVRMIMLTACCLFTPCSECLSALLLLEAVDGVWFPSSQYSKVSLSFWYCSYFFLGRSSFCCTRADACHPELTDRRIRWVCFLITGISEFHPTLWEIHSTHATCYRSRILGASLEGERWWNLSDKTHFYLVCM